MNGAHNSGPYDDITLRPARQRCRRGFRVRFGYTILMTRNLACAAAVLLLLTLAVAAQKRPAAGQAAPVFTAKTVGGATVSLAGLRGKVVLLNFWASH